MNEQQPVSKEIVFEEDEYKKVIEIVMAIGEARGHFKIEKISRFAKVKLLAYVFEKEYYGLIPGCNTALDVIEAIGMKKTKAYEELNNFKKFGEQAFEAICSMGFSARQTNRLASGQDEIEDAEYRMIEQGVLEYKGKQISFEKNPTAFMDSIRELAELSSLQRQARQGLEKKVGDEQKKADKLQKELDEKKQAIAVGEEQLRKKERHYEGFQPESDTDIGKLITHLLLITGKIMLQEVTEDDMPYINKYLDLMEFGVYQRIIEKLGDHLPKDETDI